MAALPAATISQAKALGVHDMAFHKKVGLCIEDMVKSSWVYRKLRIGDLANAGGVAG